MEFKKEKKIERNDLNGAVFNTMAFSSREIELLELTGHTGPARAVRKSDSCSLTACIRPPRLGIVEVSWSYMWLVLQRCGRSQTVDWYGYIPTNSSVYFWTAVTPNLTISLESSRIIFPVRRCLPSTLNVYHYEWSSIFLNIVLDHPNIHPSTGVV